MAWDFDWLVRTGLADDCTTDKVFPSLIRKFEGSGMKFGFARPGNAKYFYWCIVAYSSRRIFWCTSGEI